MNVEISWSNGHDSACLSANESSVWKWIASHIDDVPIPDTMDITLDDGSRRVTGKLSFCKRGCVKHADGTTTPSLFVKEDDYAPCNFRSMLVPSQYEDAYLVCINPSGNNYKFYWLKPDNVTRELGAQYGRLGSNPGERFGVKELQKKYPSYMYWIRYYEKLSKGYKDMTDVYLNDQPDTSVQISKPQPEKTEEKTELHDSPASINLYKLLLGFAQNYVNQTLAEPKKISWGQIKTSQQLYTELCEIASRTKSANGKSIQLDLFAPISDDQVQDFNSVLEKLMMVSPRQVGLVSDFLATDTDDFADIISRELSLIHAMEAVKTGQKTDKQTNKQGWLQFGIEVHSPSDTERKHVMDLIDPSMRAQVKQVYMVNPQHQRKVFDTYCKKHSIKTIKELFHGSGLENWFSITENSLLLPQHNHARKTGQALGAGLYFGNNSIKSSHYAHYANNSIIGIFDVAYGKPMKVLDSDHNCYFNHDQKELDSKGCNCLHYHRKGVNWADEIVVYSEKAVCMKAIVLL